MDLNRIKYLVEFTIKANTNKDTNVFPSYDEYIQEAAPEDGQQNAPAPKINPVQPANSEPQAPVDNAPAPEPQPAIPPAPQPEPPAPVDNSGGEEEAALMGIESQIQKTDEILQKLDQLTSKIETIEKTNAIKVQQMEKDVEEIKNPSLDKKLDNIAAKSYPFNVQLDDYFKWDSQNVPTENKLEIKLDDVENYSDSDIEDSF